MSVSSGDTDSYFTIKYTWNDTKLQNVDFSDVENSKQPGLVKQDIYQSPALLKRFYTLSQSKRNSSLHHHRIINKDGVSVEDKLVLFCQYGNLFRDCDMLEGTQPLVLKYSFCIFFNNYVAVQTTNP